MQPFEQIISIVGSIVAAIIVLTLFFKILGWVGHRSETGTTHFAVKGIFDGNTHATIHLSSGNSIENVRILGLTEPPSAKGPFPYEFSRMAILRHSDGRHTLVQVKMIRMIEIPTPFSEH